MSEQTWLEEFYPVEADEVAPEEALNHSLRKWEGFAPEALARHKIETAPIGCYSDTCALCKNFFASAPHCATCPLALSRGGVPCGRQTLAEANKGKDSPWHTMVCTGNPLPMIAALRKAKKD